MSKSESKAHMGVRQIVLFTICAAVMLESITPTAAIGPSGIFWWLVAFVTWIIPYALVTAELGTTYPADGGLYVWLSHAFGKRMGTRSVFYYWICNAIALPAAYTLLFGVLTTLFFPNLGLNEQVVIILIMAWAITFFINFSTRLGVIATVVIAACKMVVLFAMIGAGIYYVATHGSSATPITLKTIMPSSQGIGFAATIIYNLMGFELVANLGNQMRNPAKDMAKAILFSAVAVSLLYILGSFSVLVAIPQGHLNLVSGIIDALIAMLGKGWFAVVVGLLYCITSLGNQLTWFMAPSMAMAVAAQDGSFPRLLGKFHPKHQTPYIANFAAVSVSSAVAVLYAVLAAGNRTNLFWSLFSFSSALILLSYVVYFAAFLKLRFSDAATHRPFKVPGGMPGAIIAAVLCIFSALFALMLFFFPTIFTGVINWQQSAPVIGGVLVAVIVGEILIHAGERQSRKMKKTDVVVEKYV